MSWNSKVIALLLHIRFVPYSPLVGVSLISFCLYIWCFAGEFNSFWFNNALLIVQHITQYSDKASSVDFFFPSPRFTTFSLILKRQNWTCRNVYWNIILWNCLIIPFLLFRKHRLLAIVLLVKPWLLTRYNDYRTGFMTEKPDFDSLQEYRICSCPESRPPLKVPHSLLIYGYRGLLF
jgi:hypothetical protein